MFSTLLLSTAFAAEPPERPEPPAPLDHECSTTLGFDAGSSVPTFLFDSEGKAKCSAIVVPLSDYQDLLKTEIWGEHVAQSYRLDTAHLEWQVGWYRDAAEAERAANPSFNRPATWIAVGWGLGAATVLVSAYALNVVANSSSAQ